MEHLTDRALVEAVRSGSRVAFVALMRRHERAVYRIGFSYTHDLEEALDLVQEVFLKMHTRLDTYRGTGDFAAWLYRIAHRVGLNWVRDRRARRGHEELTEANAPVQPATQELELLERERRRRVRTELARLNPRQRVAVVLRYYERLPIREIARVLECSEGVAKSILFRSLRKLRNGMTRLEEDRA